MPHEFIPEGIASRVVIMENDIIEQERHGTCFAKNKAKNDLYYTIDFIENNDSEILSSCIYININE